MEGKIYVEDVEGGGFAIPVVFSSEGRAHVFSKDYQVDESIIFNLWKCSNCREWNHKWDHPTHCRNCGEPR